MEEDNKEDMEDKEVKEVEEEENEEVNYINIKYKSLYSNHEDFHSFYKIIYITIGQTLRIFADEDQI